jgi:4-carboxymuconolactone decarboxylase
VDLVVSTSDRSLSPRIGLVEDARQPASDIFASLREGGRPIPNLYKVLANAPRLLKAWVDLAWPLRNALAPRGLRELAVAYLATRRGSEYVRVHHTRFALQNGVSPDAIAALAPDGWDRGAPLGEDERTMLTLVDEVVEDGAASEETVGDLRRLFGDEQTVEIIVTVGFYEAVCVVNRSFDIPVETASPR